MRWTLLLILAPISNLASAFEPAHLEQLAWLSGCWGFEGKNSRYEEIWLAPAQDQMPGLSRRIGQDGRTREFEYLRIVATESGLDYVAQPGGRPPVHFKLVDLKAHRAVFSNPQHDFPQTITYEFRPPDELHARIEGPQGEKMTAIEFPTKRQTCEPTK